MTEKRYKKSILRVIKTGVIDENNNELNTDEVVDLLNEQHEQIQLLQVDKSDLSIDIEVQNEKINRLEEENEQLKNKIKSLTIELSTHKHPLWSTREAERVVNELKKENEELKTENHYLKNKLKRLGIIIDDVIL